MRIEGSPTTINLEKRHKEFLFEQSKNFNFSAFVRNKLDEYMLMVRKGDGGGESD